MHILKKKNMMKGFIQIWKYEFMYMMEKSKYWIKPELKKYIWSIQKSMGMKTDINIARIIMRQMK